MFIISKDGTHCYNDKYIMEMYANDHTIKIIFSNGDRMLLEEYSNHEYAKLALSMLCSAMGKYQVFNMPTEEALKGRMAAIHPEIDRYQNGKKQKGHGGS